ncbi:hypothetical protein A0H81_08844 [Grifola frondosa]|uniref:Uncharacterized protein n=1 Tax=Grifola frondosa TaxID=5627 RepID=A0A1C7M2M2_GRIFR|nr:hypothetical protein A0H81_08844 [Grifola frondosa]
MSDLSKLLPYSIAPNLSYISLEMSIGNDRSLNLDEIFYGEKVNRAGGFNHPSDNRSPSLCRMGLNSPAAAQDFGK